MLLTQLKKIVSCKGLPEVIPVSKALIKQQFFIFFNGTKLLISGICK